MVGIRTKRFVAVAAVLIAGCAAGGVSVVLASQPIQSEPCCLYSGAFEEPEYFSDRGKIPQYVNPAGSDGRHDVTSIAKGPDGKPLFRSKTIAAGEASPVAGAQYLPAATYHFYCTVHGLSMGADLTIEEKGTAVARPSLRVILPPQDLAEVRKSGRLTVKVRALTKSRGISLSARKGRHSLGSASGLNLAAGSYRNVRLALTGAGRRALKGLGSAAVSALATVPFGSPDTARRTLR